MNQVTSCHHAGCLMDAKDHEAEKIAQDGMCIDCRAHVEQRKEEEAVASFCQYHSNAVAEWHTGVLTKCGFTYQARFPEDINQTCMELRYMHGLEFSLRFTCIESNYIELSKVNIYTPTQPDWKITFHLSTPVPLILATIKAAVEHESNAITA